MLLFLSALLLLIWLLFAFLVQEISVLLENFSIEFIYFAFKDTLFKIIVIQDFYNIDETQKDCFLFFTNHLIYFNWLLSNKNKKEANYKETRLDIIGRALAGSNVIFVSN